MLRFTRVNWLIAILIWRLYIYALSGVFQMNSFGLHLLKKTLSKFLCFALLALDVLNQFIVTLNGLANTVEVSQ